MKSLVLHDFGDLRIEEVERPSARPGWVVIKLLTIQPSITEVLVSRGLETSGTSQVREMLKGGPVATFGHELCGEVVEVGEDTKRLAKGDRVTSAGEIPCGSCPFCLEGRQELCRDRIGMSVGIPGSRFAEFAAMPEAALVKVPRGISDSEAAAMQPLSNCIEAVRSAQIGLGDKVAVIGQGVMGLAAMQLSRVAGSGTIISTDVKEQNRKLSKELGADEVVDPSTTDFAQRVMELTRGEGVDAVFEASGGNTKLGLSGSGGIELALKILRPGGRLVQIALLPSIALSLGQVTGKKLIFPQAENIRSIEQAVNFVSTGRVRLSPLITHRLKGIDSVPMAFEITGNKAKYGAVNPAQISIA